MQFALPLSRIQKRLATPKAIPTLIDEMGGSGLLKLWDCNRRPDATLREGSP